MTPRKSFKMASTFALVGAAALLTNMTPASAAGVGVSTGTSALNTDNVNGPLPICAHASGVEITLSNTGAFSAGDQTFAGTSTATFDATAGFWFSPLGVFSDNLCTTPTPVTGTLSVTGTGLSCSGVDDNAVYTRQGANAYAITTLVGSNSCTVNGVTASSILTFAGNQDPCFGEDFPLPLPDPCAFAPEFVGVYAQLP